MRKSNKEEIGAEGEAAHERGVYPRGAICRRTPLPPERRCIRKRQARRRFATAPHAPGAARASHAPPPPPFLCSPADVRQLRGAIASAAGMASAARAVVCRGVCAGSSRSEKAQARVRCARHLRWRESSRFTRDAILFRLNDAAPMPTTRVCRRAKRMAAAIEVYVECRSGVQRAPARSNAMSARSRQHVRTAPGFPAPPSSQMSACPRCLRYGSYRRPPMLYDILQQKSSRQRGGRYISADIAFLRLTSPVMFEGASEVVGNDETRAPARVEQPSPRADSAQAAPCRYAAAC